MRALVREGSVGLTGFSAVSKSGCLPLLAPSVGSSRLVLPLIYILFICMRWSSSAHLSTHLKVLHFFF